MCTCTCYSYLLVPTPPGPIFIRQTNSSLHLKWASPAYMEGASNISYHITYQSQDGEVQNQNTIVNYTELPSLSSGTLYNVTVETVGPQNLRSTVVRNSCFTRKYNREKPKDKRTLYLT